MTKSFAFSQAGDDWRARIRAMSAPQAIALAARARKAPLFAHAYAFHLNFRFGGMTPAALLEFAVEQGLIGVKIHVEDGEASSLRSMSDAELQQLGAQAVALGLAVHVETSTTAEEDLRRDVAIAKAVGAGSFRCYPRYEGRVSEIIARATKDLRRLEQFDPDGQMRFTLEQHEDLTSAELVGIIKRVGNPRLSLLFDFGNMINAFETPLEALAIQAPHVTEVHVKDCLVVPDRGGWAHLACISGQGHLPMHGLLIELLLLGETAPQVTAFGLEEEDAYFAPALRFPSEDADPFIQARTASYTDPGLGDLAERLIRETAAAQAQVATIRTMLDDIAAQAELQGMQT